VNNKSGKAIAGLAIAVAFGTGIGIGTSTTSPQPGKTVSVPGPTVTVTGPDVTVTASPAQPSTGAVLGTWKGSGNSNTPQFIIPGSGDYIVSWQYSGNVDPSFGGGTNFAITNTNADALSTSLPNDIAASGHGSTEVTGGSGNESFNVQSSAQCNWSITVKSAS
jgi:hypothetical protein